MSALKTLTLQPSAPNTSTKDQTTAIQALLTRCEEEGGGTVMVTAGDYTWGSIRIFSNTTLHFNSGVVIRGSEVLADYQDFGLKTNIDYVTDEYFVKAWHLPKDYFHALIAAYDAENVSITADAGAIIDGRDLYDAAGEEGFRGPMGLVFSRVKGLHLTGYLVQNSANWSHVIDTCTDVKISGVTINAGHDGFNLQHSDQVEISNCVLHTGDDCLAGYDIDGLHVHDCWFNTACNGMRIGGKNLTLEQCTFVGPGLFPHRSEDTYDAHAFFKYYAINADHHRFDSQHIVFNHIQIADWRQLLVYEWGSKTYMQDARPLQDVTFNHAEISKMHQTSIFKGNGKPVRLTFNHSQITPLNEEVFLAIDDTVTLDLHDVVFTKPTKIELGDGRVLTLTGQVDLLIDGQRG